MIKVSSVPEEYYIVQQFRCCDRNLDISDCITQGLIIEEPTRDILTFQCPVCKLEHEFIFDISSFLSTPEEVINE